MPTKPQLENCMTAAQEGEVVVSLAQSILISSVVLIVTNRNHWQSGVFSFAGP